MLNHITAKDSIRELFYTRFVDFVTNGISSESIPALGLKKRGSTTTYIPAVNWRNVEKVDPNDNGVHFLHFTMQNVIKRQKTLAGGRVDNVGTCYTTRGFVTVEIYFSKSAYQTIDEDRLSMIVERCFVQQNSGCIWFRNTTIVDLDPEENHYRSNVLAEYEYDSVIN